MGFAVNRYAKIWKVERFEKYSKVNLSTSAKKKDSDEYDTDFSAFVMLLGKAHAHAETLEDGDRIKITSCEVKTKYDKTKNEKYTNYYLYDYEDAGTTNGESNNKPDYDAGKASSKNSDALIEEEDSDDLPF